VFSLLPQLLERAGTGEQGSITGLFTTLVEQDDMNDPIADAVRSILDGHIVLSRELATQNHYPAIEVLDSVSRLSRDLCSADQIELAGQAREALSLYRRNQDLINIGAYPAGSNGAIDHAIRLHEPLKRFLRQGIREGFAGAESWQLLGRVMTPPPVATPRPVLTK
jgi:flagellum-specific ATP synthase